MTFDLAQSLMVNPRAWLAEGISTFALVFFGPLSVIMAAAAFGTGLSIEGILLISFAHGAAIGLMIYSFGHISGAHINPAVTIPMIITKKIRAADGAGYIALSNNRRNYCSIYTSCSIARHWCCK